MSMPMRQPEGDPYEYIPLPDRMQENYLSHLSEVLGQKGRKAGENSLKLYVSGRIGPIWADVRKGLQRYRGLGKLPTLDDISGCGGLCSVFLLQENLYAACVLGCLYRKLVKRRKGRRR